MAVAGAAGLMAVLQQVYSVVAGDSSELDDLFQVVQQRGSAGSVGDVHVRVRVRCTDLSSYVAVTVTTSGEWTW